MATQLIEYTGKYEKEFEDRMFIYCTIGGKKSNLRKIDGKLFKTVVVKQEMLTCNQCTLLIIALAKKLNYTSSGGHFGHSFYKTENGMKYRISDHPTLTKWADVYGYADEEIRIHHHLTKAEIVSEIESTGCSFDEIMEMGKQIDNDNFYRNIERQQQI